MRTLTVEVPDAVYQALEQMAAGSHRPVESVARDCLSTLANGRQRPPLSGEELKAEWDKLLRFAGAFHSGDPHFADAERIEADLAREYDNNHEEEGQ